MPNSTTPRQGESAATSPAAPAAHQVWVPELVHMPISWCPVHPVTNAICCCEKSTTPRQDTPAAQPPEAPPVGQVWVPELVHMPISWCLSWCTCPLSWYTCPFCENYTTPRQGRFRATSEAAPVGNQGWVQGGSVKRTGSLRLNFTDTPPPQPQPRYHINGTRRLTMTNNHSPAAVVRCLRREGVQGLSQSTQMPTARGV